VFSGWIAIASPVTSCDDADPLEARVDIGQTYDDVMDTHG
jgi:hypothetical protein